MSFRRGIHSGNRFQQLVDMVNMGYEQQGQALITRKSIPGKFVNPSRRYGTRILGSTGGSEIGGYSPPIGFVPESKAEPDYGGVVYPDGRAIVYDAKSTKRDKLDLDNLHAHQVEFLRRAGRMGAISGFLVEFSIDEEIFFIPIQFVDMVVERCRRKSLPLNMLRDYLGYAPPGKGLIVFDYLASIGRIEDHYGRQIERFDLSALPVKQEIVP